MNEKLLHDQNKKEKFSLQKVTKIAPKNKKMESLVEEFTSEVTLVTEGLWNDQKKLRDQINDMSMEQTLWEKKEEDARISLLEEMSSLKRQVDILSEKMVQIENKKVKREKNVLKQISVLVFVITGSWVLVTIINGVLQLISK